MAKFFKRIRAFLRGEIYPPRKRNPYPPALYYRREKEPTGRHGTALPEWVRPPVRRS